MVIHKLRHLKEEFASIKSDDPGWYENLADVFETGKTSLAHTSEKQLSKTKHSCTCITEHFVHICLTEYTLAPLFLLLHFADSFCDTKVKLNFVKIPNECVM